jgi:hypothetical protein
MTPVIPSPVSLFLAFYLFLCFFSRKCKDFQGRVFEEKCQDLERNTQFVGDEAWHQ